MRQFIYFIFAFVILFSQIVYSQSSHEFTIARLKYDGGGDWYSNPTSLPNLLTQLRERLNMDTTLEEAVVTPADSKLFDYPIVYMNGHGTVKFSSGDVKNLQEYFKRGGFLWADDNYGMDKSFRKEIAKVFPNHVLVEISHDHPLFSLYYKFDQGLPKIHEHDGGAAVLYGIFVDGRLAVLYTFNTDIGDGLESEGVHPQDPPEVREQAMRMAVNIIVYAQSN